MSTELPCTRWPNSNQDYRLTLRSQGSPLSSVLATISISPSGRCDTFQEWDKILFHHSTQPHDGAKYVFVRSCIVVRVGPHFLAKWENINHPQKDQASSFSKVPSSQITILTNKQISALKIGLSNAIPHNHFQWLKETHIIHFIDSLRGKCGQVCQLTAGPLNIKVSPFPPMIVKVPISFLQTAS